MKILKIHAENFRTLKNIEIKFVSDYCTLSGKNNAGKSTVVKIIEHFLEDQEAHFYRDERTIDYHRDSTQWEKGAIRIGVDIQLHRDDDSELYYFVNNFANRKLTSEVVCISLETKIDSSATDTTVCVDGEQLETRASIEVLKKFKSASNLIIHNSTRPHSRFYYQGDEMVEFIESQFSDEDNKKIVDAQNTLHSRVRSAARKHKEALGEYLGRLKENYEIELVPPERSRAQRVPLSIKLADKSVEVPLHEWGTGTQNRTRALISVFGAARARSASAPSDRVTAVVIIEEPESFLHPSAQAEFGKVLNQLASEVSVQIIATTHSPYMLNQTSPEANILLDRKVYRGHLRETQVIETSGENWMRPFSENLGLVPEEFSALRDLFKLDSGRVLLVEGSIDKEYLEHIRDNYPHIYQIPHDVEIVPYGGKDTLKSSVLVKFIFARFDRVFVTYDLDAEKECGPALLRLGLVEGEDFCSVGTSKPGQSCIEGLAPESVRSAVFRDNPDLVMALSSDGGERKKAKDALKGKILAEFKKLNLADDDLKEFKQLLKRVAKRFN